MPTYSVVTFGCQMNEHDSERIGEVLRGAGYQECAETADADLILLNTCSVREKAEQKLRSEVGRLGLLKKQRPHLVIGVAGCVAQQEGDRLLKRMPQIDVLVGPDNIRELPRLLADVELGAPPVARTVFDLEEPVFLQAAPTPGRQGASAFVTTMKGCDERCTFCIVPTTRGPERYRPSGDVLEEVARVVAAGAKEVVLLGQTVDSYRDPSGLLEPAPLAGLGRERWGRGRLATEDETEFPALLFAIAKAVPALQRLRYTSPHPRHLTPALVEAHRQLPVLAKHVHMPVQSGSDRILKRMGRRYRIEEYEERIGLLREQVPGLTLSTDIIVGFPGETREDFEQTLALVQRLGFIGVFAFKYSERPSTPALQLANDVPEEEKALRLAELFDLSEGMRFRHLQTLVGTEAEVLVESRAADAKAGKDVLMDGAADTYTGRTERNEIVHIKASTDLRRQIVKTRIEHAFRHSLAGTLVDAEGALPVADLLSARGKRMRSLPVLL